MEKNLWLYSFELKKCDLPNLPIYRMDIPASWRDVLKAGNQNMKVPMKLTNLGLKLRCLFPQIIAGYDDQINQDSPKPWLIAVHKVNPEWISKLSFHWLKGQLEKKSDLASGIKPVKLEWFPYKLDDIWNDPQVLYHVVPGLFAHVFCREPRQIVLPNKALMMHFAHVHYGKDHECMSLPVTEGRSAKGKFSYVLRLQMKNRGGRAEQPLLNVRVGTRRFQTKPAINADNGECYIKFGVKSSMLISIDNPLMMQPETPITMAQLTYQRRNSENTYTQWTSGLDDLFLDVLFGKKIFSDDILQKPERYMEGSNGLRAMVVHSPRVFPIEPEVKAGLGLPERKALFQTFQSTFNLIARVSPIPEIATKSFAARLPIKISREKELVMEFWMSQQMYNHVVGILTSPIKELNDQVLLSPTAIPNKFKLNSDDELVIRTIQRDNGWLVQELEGQQLGFKKAWHKRAAEIYKNVKRESRKVVALIEIDRPDVYKANDPKTAVRDGFRKVGRLTQFIYRIDNNDDKESKSGVRSRVLNAVLDLLADAGFLRNNVDDIVSGNSIVAVDIIQHANGKRGQQYLPVLVWYKDKQIKVKKLGDKDWLSLSHSLLEFNSIKPMHKKEGQRFYEWVQQEIERLLLTNTGIIYLLVDAELRNSWWNLLKNPLINQEKVPFSDMALFEKGRLRVIRINHTDDVPQYDIESKKGDVNRFSGLFGCPEGFYYSIGMRPDNMMTNLKLLKVDYPSKLIMKQQAVELIVLGTADKAEKDKLAGMVHNLRRANLTYKASTSQPFPLHLMKSIKKYWQAQIPGQANGISMENGDLDERFRISIVLKRYSGSKRWGIKCQ